MDLIPYFIAALEVLVPALAIYLVGRARGIVIGQKRAGMPQRPICTCGHGYGFHESGGTCRSTSIKTFNYKEKVFECACRFYDGPEPLPRSWKPGELEGGTP